MLLTGRLGNGNESDEFAPVPVKFEAKSVEICKIACGTDCTFFLTTSGKLLACGSNEDNKLGSTANTILRNKFIL